MEVKEYIQILRKNAGIFWMIVGFVVALTFICAAFRPVSYNTSLALNITRSGSQQTADYKYDDFYRLQADEKFAETVAQWLKDPRTVADIYAAAGIESGEMSLRQLSKSFSPEKLSSQIVNVTFSTPDPGSSVKISGAIKGKISESAAQLNADQQEASWFEIVAQKPITVRSEIEPLILLIASLVFGIFLSFWAVLVIHYFK